MEKFLDTVYLSTDLLSNDLSLTYIFYSVDSKADVDIMYDIRELFIGGSCLHRGEQFFNITCCLIDHFTVVCLVAWPLNESEAGVDFVLIET